MRGRVALMVLTAVGALVACGDDESTSTDPSKPASTTTSVPASTTTSPEQRQVYAFEGTVLESPDHGPQLCGAVDESLPPQCGGPDVVGLDWAQTPEHRSIGGTTWSDHVRLVGTFDPDTFSFTLTEPPGEAGPVGPGPDVSFAVPCPEPAGGWEAVKAANGGNDDWSPVGEYAQGQDDFAGLWVAEQPGGVTVLVVAFTGDLDGHQQDIDAIYRGPVCLVAADRTETELTGIVNDLMTGHESRAAGILPISGSVDVIRNIVTVETWIVDDVMRAWVDAEYGGGAVELTALLAPVSP